MWLLSWHCVCVLEELPLVGVVYLLRALLASKRGTDVSGSLEVTVVDEYFSIYFADRLGK